MNKQMKLKYSIIMAVEKKKKKKKKITISN